MAEQAGAVGYEPNTNVLTAAIAPNSILVLKQKLMEIQAYYEKEVQRAMTMIPQPPKPVDPADPADQNKDVKPEPPKPVTKLITVPTLTTKPMKTAQDVEEYLDGIRKYLMKFIENGESILPKK